MSANEIEIGQIQWHTSEEDGPPDVGMLLRIDEHNHLWVGEITRCMWEERGGEELGSDGGWWIIHYGKDTTRVIGKCLAAWPELDMDFLDILAAAISKAQPSPERTDP